MERQLPVTRSPRVPPLSVALAHPAVLSSCHVSFFLTLGRRGFTSLLSRRFPNSRIKSNAKRARERSPSRPGSGRWRRRRRRRRRRRFSAGKPGLSLFRLQFVDVDNELRIFSWDPTAGAFFVARNCIGMTMASVHALSGSVNGTEENVPDEQQSNGRSENQYQHPANENIQPGMAMPSAEYMIPLNHLEVGHTMAQVYPYVDPYYGGIIPTFTSQTVVHPHLVSVLQPAVTLPSEVEPVYVNAKQYNGILRRRQSRAKAESENKLIKNRKPYLHESRHLHALKRARGCGGRFLNSKIEDHQKRGEKNLPGDAPTSENSCSGSLENPLVSQEMNDRDCDKKPLDDACHPSVVTV